MSTTTLTPIPAQTLRGTDLQTVVGLLQDNRSRTLDVVMKTNEIRSENGYLVIDQGPILSEDGVTTGAMPHTTADIVDQQLGSLFEIPVGYVRRMRAKKVTLLDQNINAWAGDAEGTVLLRILQGTDVNHPGSVGLVRAILSSKFSLNHDHLDTVMSFLTGLRSAGLDGNNITGIDLSPERLYISVDVPQIAIDAKELVKNYRSPFSGQTGDELPMMNAGLVFTNSEVGRGAFSILPKATLQVCTNGLTRAVDGFRKIHIGGRLEEGTVSWSADTQKAANQFVQAQVKDAVASFLSEGYLENLRDDLLRDAGVEVTDVVKTIEVVTKKQQYSAAESEMILADFIKGGQVTSGGILNAVTSVAQRIEDPDRAFEFGLSAIPAMKVAAQYAMANA